MANKSRAEYFRKRRETRKLFAVLLDRDTLSRFEQKLLSLDLTKADWLKSKINEELKNFH